MTDKITDKKSKGGRPSIYTDDIADLICECIAEGKSMVSIGKKPGMPKPRTVYRWIRENPEFRHNYENAKEDQADMFVEEMRDISLSADSDSVQVARLQIDVMKWTASKFKNKRYGDKLTTDNTNTTNLDNLSEEELDKKVKALINAAS
tara:strand:+ start:22 stop:468 length:447 start_codon:yes stop_codon:yes gene_type:complete